MTDELSAIDKVRAHVEAHRTKERATFTVAGVAAIIQAMDQHREWTTAWHRTVETMCVLIGINGSGSPEEILAELQSKLSTLSGMAEPVAWQPIETAPKDRLIDVWTVGYGAEPHRMSDCYYDRICDEWRTSRPSGHLMCIKAKYVTHWMTRPTPPVLNPEGK